MVPEVVEKCCVGVCLLGSQFPREIHGNIVSWLKDMSNSGEGLGLVKPMPQHLGKDVESKDTVPCHPMHGIIPKPFTELQCLGLRTIVLIRPRHTDGTPISIHRNVRRTLARQPDRNDVVIMLEQGHHCPQRLLCRRHIGGSILLGTPRTGIPCRVRRPAKSYWFPDNGESGRPNTG